MIMIVVGYKAGKYWWGLPTPAGWASQQPGWHVWLPPSIYSGLVQKKIWKKVKKIYPGGISPIYHYFSICAWINFLPPIYSCEVKSIHSPADESVRLSLCIIIPILLLIIIPISSPSSSSSSPSSPLPEDCWGRVDRIQQLGFPLRACLCWQELLNGLLYEGCPMSVVITMIIITRHYPLDGLVMEVVVLSLSLMNHIQGWLLWKAVFTNKKEN